MMLTGGRTPCLPGHSIVEIRLQQKVSGYQTDDLIVITQRGDAAETKKLLVSIKRSISITKSDRDFAAVIGATWADFNNPNKFCRGKDRIALITGPLSKTDIQNARWLLAQAQAQNQPEMFFRNVQQAKFSSAEKIKKLEAFRHHLQSANGGKQVSENEIFHFLRHFNLLGYDLDEEFGGSLPPYLSLIAQASGQIPEPIWATIVDFVQTRNQHAGIMTLQDLPEDITKMFKWETAPPPLDSMISAYIENPALHWNNQEKAELALINLVGAWDGHNDADISAIRSIIGTTQNSEWRSKTEDMLNLPNSPLKLQTGQYWSVTDRSDLWGMLESYIFDHHLDTYKHIAIEVLMERDPAFDLPAKDRYAASIYGKTPKYSPALKKGLADGLAMLGNKLNPEKCSPGKAKNTVALAVRQILSTADWKLWGSLSPVLPALAEAAPDQFLKAVESALLQSPCPYDTLFEQEGDGTFGDNYLTGLLWALESLAWDKDHLMSTCVILARLAERDPGGNWANRPGVSLSTILLPQRPQTLAALEKRKATIKAVCQECPESSWNLVTSLLPRQLAYSGGSHKPIWRNAITLENQPKVTGKDYWQQVDSCASLAINMAGQNPARLAELLDHMKTLPKSFQEHLLAVLSSDDIVQLPDDQKRAIWEKLVSFIALNRQHPKARWALNDHDLTKIETVAEHLKPSNPMEHSRYLFSDPDIKHYETTAGNLEEQARCLQERRQKAVLETLELDGAADVRRVIHFANTVENPNQVGFSLGHIAAEEIDTVVLPEYLNSSNQKLNAFASGYVRSRHHAKGWAWADELDRSAWTSKQVGQFLCYLPFTQETWIRASDWLGDRQSEFWSRTHATPYHEEGRLDAAIDQLLEHDRPHAAIGCLERMHSKKMPVDSSQCIHALLATAKSTEPSDTMEQYHIVELIKLLQGKPDVPVEELRKVEWAYLQLLENCGDDTSPKALESQLADDPSFFCEIIRLVYRPKDADYATDQPTEAEQRIAHNAMSLIHQWKTVPGTQADGEFDDAKFIQWLHDVKRICAETGHLEIALVQVGKILFHSPPDPSGLWIRHSIANALNDIDGQDLRSGYSSGWYNSRGVHHIHPTGKPELELAADFREKADAVENERFQRLATTLRELAKGYDNEANRIVAEYGIR